MGVQAAIERSVTQLGFSHFGFGKDGTTLADDALPAKLTADWRADKDSSHERYPSYARVLPQRGTGKSESRYSWTVDFGARRAAARDEMRPLLDDTDKLKAEIVDLKETSKRLKKDQTKVVEIAVLEASIREKDKAARDLEAKAAVIDALVFDLKAVNPNSVAKVDDRTPQQIIYSILEQGRLASEALARLSSIIADDKSSARIRKSREPVKRKPASRNGKAGRLSSAHDTFTGSERRRLR